MTERQQRFVVEYLKDGNATQAARRAGFSHKTAGQIGARLLKDVHIASALEAVRAPARENAGITFEGHLAELARIRDAAFAMAQFGAASSAETNRGKVAGYYVDRSVVETRELPKLVLE